METFCSSITAGSIVAHGELGAAVRPGILPQPSGSAAGRPAAFALSADAGPGSGPAGAVVSRGRAGAWWGLQALCLATCATIFYRTTPLPRHLRINMLVGLAALVPLWIAVGIGHLCAHALVGPYGRIDLAPPKPAAAGGSVLVAVWPSSRNLSPAWLSGCCSAATCGPWLGLVLGAAIQFAVVALALGPGIWLDYLRALPGIAASTRAYVYSPLFEQSFAGIASNLVDSAGLPGLKIPAMRIAYAITSAAAAVALCRVVAARRPFSVTSPVQQESAGWTLCRRNYEYACGVLFMTIFPPYFLVYDQTLLAFPLVMLWASPGWRWGVLLMAVSAVPLANLSFALGFSVTGVVALATMISLAARQATLRRKESVRCEWRWRALRNLCRLYKVCWLTRRYEE